MICRSKASSSAKVIAETSTECKWLKGGTYARDMGVLLVRTAMLLGYYDRLHSTGSKTKW